MASNLYSDLKGYFYLIIFCNGERGKYFENRLDLMAIIVNGD